MNMSVEKQNRKDINSPPDGMIRLASFLFASHLQEELLGDLHERFNLRCKKLGKQKARSFYLIEVIFLIRPSILKRKASPYSATSYFQPAMIRNYYKIAFRNLWKHKAFSLINILGLAIGMSACLLIFLYVSFELSYDDFNRKTDRIYRLVTDIKTPSETLNLEVTSWSFAPNIKKDYPEIEAFTRFFRASFLITKGSLSFQEEKTMFADSSLLSVFDFTLVKGDPKTALKDPLSIVLSQKAATKYFGDADPLGQTLLFSDKGLAAKVTGIMQNIPENSQIKGDIFVSMSTLTTRLNKNLDDQCGNFGAVSYLLLKPGTDPLSLKKNCRHFLMPTLEK